MRPPKGYELESGAVFRLKKSLYGLKQSARNWHGVIDPWLQSGGMEASAADPCVYVMKVQQGGGVSSIWGSNWVLWKWGGSRAGSFVFHQKCSISPIKPPNG